MKIQGYMQKPEEYPVVAEFEMEFGKGSFPVSIVKIEGSVHKIVDNATRAPLVTFKTRGRKASKLIKEGMAEYERRINNMTDETPEQANQRFYDKLVAAKAPPWVKNTATR